MGRLTSPGALNLIDALNFYLILCFVLGTVIRIRNYRAILGFICAFRDRWPKLFELVKKHKTVLLRWPTLLPIGLTLALMLANTLASQLIWSQAQVTFEDLWGHGAAFVAVMISGAFMVFLDAKAVFRVGRFDRAALEKDLIKAEHWLQSWKAPALRFVTFGFINPRKIVNEQILDALTRAALVVNGQMWRWSLQIGMRLAFGLAIWMTWAIALRPAARQVLSH